LKLDPSVKYEIAGLVDACERRLSLCVLFCSSNLPSTYLAAVLLKFILGSY
jgi:hypothetical protein